MHLNPRDTVCGVLISKRSVKVKILLLMKLQHLLLDKSLQSLLLVHVTKKMPSEKMELQVPTNIPQRGAITSTLFHSCSKVHRDESNSITSSPHEPQVEDLLYCH